MNTTPNVPYLLELSVEVPGTPEQVWQAIATAMGMSASHPGDAEALWSTLHDALGLGEQGATTPSWVRHQLPLAGQPVPG